MDRVSQTDPIWTARVAQKKPIPVIRLTGEVVWINTSATKEPDDAVLTPEDELRIADVTVRGRSELRREFETVFGGTDWPKASALVEWLRRYATKVFDANALAYCRVASTQGRDPNEVLTAICRNLLVVLFGREWEGSPGEKVVRTDWQYGVEGWKGTEVVAIAGNDPDPNCLYHELIGDAIKYRYRFHAVPQPPLPGEPPGINLSNLEWWQYIGLNERHNLATAIKPYLEDRMAHWELVYKSSTSSNTASGECGRETVRDVAAEQREAKAQKAKPSLRNRAAWLRKQLAARAWNKHDLYRYGGPDHKSAQKILDGFRIREDVLEKVVNSLSKKNGKVNLLDIPQD
jgi:hypothetical protein